MKIRILLALICVALAAVHVTGKQALVVGIDRSTSSTWDSIASTLEQEMGIDVSFKTYPQSSVAQQIVFQAFTRSGKHHFFMVPDSWGVSLSRYLTDLSDVAADLTAAGVSPSTFSGRPLGVPLPFAPGWFLAVISWPDDREAALALLIAAAGGADGQDLSPVGTQVTQPTSFAALTTQKMARSSHNPKIDGALGVLLAAVEETISSAASQIATALPSSARNTLAAVADALGVPFSAATSTVTVVLEPRPGTGSASTVAALSSLGISPSAIDSSSSLVKATVPLAELASLASKLTGVSFFRAPYIPFLLGTPTEGTAAIGADAFHSAGITGTGVKVAIIDLGFVGLTQAQARGDLPYSAIQNDLTGTGLATGYSHGTAVAEVIHDIAPDAQLHLIKIADEIDLDQAVTYCLSNGIDIINHSLGWYNTNYYDGMGTLPDIARRATSTGILWVNAAGNEAESHWEGPFTDGNSDGWHDTSVSFYASSGSQIVLFLTWNEWPAGSTDYDLYLYGPSSDLVASSTKYQTGIEEPTESIQATAPQSGTYSIRIQGAGSRNLELFSVLQNITPAVPSSSILAPANASEVVAVGAVSQSSYATGPQESYSSQGPTNDGRAKPDLVAPDNVTTGTSPYTSFPGTSASAPHVSGGAALLLSQQPTLSGSALRSLLLSHTIAMGAINVYGNGRLFLQPPTASNQPPTASFSFAPSPATVGSAVSFNASASTDPDGSVISFLWDFDSNGTTDATGVSATRTFSSAGTYQVRLTVTDDDGATATVTQPVAVIVAANQPPTASFSFAPSPATVGSAVSFNAGASTDPDGSIISFLWDFDSNGTTDATGVSATHAFSSAGTFQVRLTVTDNDGATATATHPITVIATANQPPTASFTASPTPAAPNQWITFDASGSSDPDGYIDAYAWNFGDSTIGSGATTHHAYANPGTYAAQLIVTDDDSATGTISQQIIVQAAAAPDLTISSLNFSPSSPTIGQTLTFSFTVQNIGNENAGFFRIRLQGAGPTAQTYLSGLSAGSSRTLSLSLPLSAASETLAITADDLGQVAESDETNNTRSVTVTASSTPPPLAEAGGPYNGTAGQPILFNGSTSTGSITSSSWTFGDGGTASGLSTTHTYGVPGLYTASLTVTGPGGQSSDYAQVSVGQPVQALSAQVSLPKTTYRVGENFVATYTTNRTAYVYLCEVTPDNRVIQLYPNLRENTNPVPAGTHTLPSGSYTISASEPIGTENLYLFAATRSLPEFQTSFWFGFPTLSTNPTAFRDGVIATMQTLVTSGDWALDSISFQVIPETPTTGTLEIVTFPSNASILLDGTPIGTSPLRQSGVAQGTHIVQISKSGYQTEERQVTITAGATMTLQVTLVATPPANIPPNASFNASPSSPIAGASVQFDGQVSSDPDGSIVSYAWSFGDGGTAVGPVVSHVFANGGNYQVRLTVTDNGGASNTYAYTLAVASGPTNIPPNASFNASPSSPIAGASVQFDGQVSSDPDGSIVSYAWSFGDGGTAVGPVVSHVFASDGNYQVRLTVTDNGGASNTYTYTISVTSSENVGWISPVSHQDPSGGWKSEANAYDENINPEEVNGAYASVPGKEWTSFLFFAAPGGGLQSNAIRFWWASGGGAFTWDIDVERDGEWVNVYDSTASIFKPTADQQKWITVSFDEGLVTRARFRAHNISSGAWRAKLYELDFRDATIP